ncbi:protein ROOT HAIR DEFECTIVE 3 homolog 2-like isoform X1 [Malus domestica]|uniref:protein ROOT HAIR DEFECTIVE 3 homolog 2-like isoform X1 n=1 Tax=Malus domestica TaxID=3750 RepID=UPI0010A9BEDB|nr:protein ROOT HAIR DEFECTIVE 3 homolog 2-like isoform X1 [Malus domestica]
MEREDSCGTQLIYGNCEFNSYGLDTFVERVKFPKCREYVVVSIIGPQSGGKSTLMNHLFDTKFQEMNPDRRSQTTKGIWIAKCVGVEPCTLALDIEGTDGSERGQDDTAFEKKSALFAMAISDIVMINMWCHDLGRENAANKPLLRTVFQIWDAVPKPQAHERTPFSEFFSVHVVGLSNYEFLKEKFEEEVAQLKQRLVNSTSSGSLPGYRRRAVPASAFSLMIQQIWKEIKQNKDLDLPSQRVMVATMRCEATADKTLGQFMESERWLSLQKAAETGPVQDFGKRVSSILYYYLSEYDKEVVDFDEGVRKSKRHMLESRALQSAQAVYNTMLVHLCSKAFEGFKVRAASLNPEKGFDESLRACILSSMREFRQWCADASLQHRNWSFSTIVEKLQRDIDVHAASFIRSAKLSELKLKYKEQLVASLTSQVDPAFGDGGEGMWVSIRRILKLETENAISRLSIQGFELEEKEFNAMRQYLSNIARNVVEQKARDNIVAEKVLTEMKDRFSRVFCYDSNSQPRAWKKKKHITVATEEAHSASLKILAVMATIDLDEKRNYDELFSCLTKEIEDSLPSSWNNVSLKDTLFTPVQCQRLWYKFKEMTQKYIVEATSSMEAHKRHKRTMARKIALGTAAAAVNVSLAVMGIPSIGGAT